MIILNLFLHSLYVWHYDYASVPDIVTVRYINLTRKVSVMSTNRGFLPLQKYVLLLLYLICNVDYFVSLHSYFSLCSNTSLLVRSAHRKITPNTRYIEQLIFTLRLLLVLVFCVWLRIILLKVFDWIFNML